MLMKAIQREEIFASTSQKTNILHDYYVYISLTIFLNQMQDYAGSQTNSDNCAYLDVLI
jgi:hypothetical protein